MDHGLALTVFLGLLVTAAIVGGVYIAKHPHISSAPPAKDLINTVTAGLDDKFETLSASFADLVQGIPALTSAQIVQLQGDLEAARQELAETKAALAKSQADHAADLAAVASRVAVAIGASPELPAPPDPPPQPVFADTVLPEGRMA